MLYAVIVYPCGFGYLPSQLPYLGLLKVAVVKRKGLVVEAGGFGIVPCPFVYIAKVFGDVFKYIYHKISRKSYQHKHKHPFGVSAADKLVYHLGGHIYPEIWENCFNNPVEYGHVEILGVKRAHKFQRPYVWVVLVHTSASCSFIFSL